MEIIINPHLSPVIPPNAPRLAEPTDARLPIREHEEQARRKKDDDDKKETMLPDDSYDQSVLGVRALIDFLKNFVQGQGEMSRPGTTATQAPSDPVSITPVPPSPPSPTFSNASARAASAYRHSAETAHPIGAHYRVPASGSGGPGAPVDLLHNAEIRQIYDIIALLETLEKQGIQGIRLERAPTFVTAIENAAQNLLS